jgi:hypothetical protein
METNELKNIWSSLDESLKKQELLNENILREMLEAKSNKSLSRLINQEAFGAIVILLLIPVLIVCFEVLNLLSFNLFTVVLIGLSIIGCIWQAIKTFMLLKIDFSKPISSNIRQTNTYNLYMKREKFAMIFLLPLMFFVLIYLYIRLDVDIVLWIFLACAIVTCLFAIYWLYKKVYDKNIHSILKSLDELKDLDEAEDETP